MADAIRVSGPVSGTDKTLSFETGKLAQQSQGAVLASIGRTIVLATASSDAVLPQVMRKLEFLGVKKSVVGLVVPTGYTFNTDGTSIFLSPGRNFSAGTSGRAFLSSSIASAVR